MKLKSLWADFVDLIFPRCCEACDQALVGTEQVICTACRIELPRLDTDSSLKNLLKNRLVSHHEVKEVRSYLVFTKKGKVQNLLHALKYNNRPEVGTVLGELFGHEMLAQQEVPMADLIVSVPLHPRRLRQRGYNQSDQFAAGLSRALGIPWSGSVLVRTRYTQSQTGKTKVERQENVRRIFKVNESISGQKIILVDDVLTTGATLEACVDALVEGGCGCIYIMTIAAAQ
ncbi:ComF family protein [Rhabdobacter roseus]|uniref:ComF family protein n=1 Tax=Rhabdobacter roseus TaxID=1655419 RepID=A0A840U1A0_9BACT|nr:ComF family protein [Rhabdobacter roseus]MBB5287363.1 ComF family protein [Rhabdobacter roseus]